VLTIAVIQLIGAIITGISAIATILGLITFVVAEQNGEVEANSATYGAAIAVTIFSVLTACMALATGIMGIKATSNLQAVVALQPQILKSARTYFYLMVTTWLIFAVPNFISLIVQSVGLGQRTDLRPGDRFAGIAFAWVWWALFIVVQLYFIFVVWSYQRRLHDARDGRLEGPFVVKGQQPTHTGVPVGAQQAAQSQPTYGGPAVSKV